MFDVEGLSPMGLEQNILNEPVAKLNLRKAITVDARTSIAHACELMREQGVGCVVVIDAGKRPVGKFTERILIDLLANERCALDRSVGQYMALVWEQVRLTDPIIRVIDAMREHNLRFVVVVDDQGQVVGLTGQRGIAEYVAEHFPHHVMTSRAGRSPAITRREGA